MALTVTSVAQFDAEKLLVEVVVTYSTGWWWWKKRHRGVQLYLTRYGIQWHVYPEGREAGLDMDMALDRAYNEYKVRQRIDKELES